MKSSGWLGNGRGACIAGFGTLVAVMVAAERPALAAHYKVLTSSIAASSTNANDGYCSLAEAVESVNTNTQYHECRYVTAGGEDMITLLEAPGKPYASFHYVIGTLTLKRSVRFQPSEEGFTAYIDSTGTQGFKVNSGIEVTFYGIDMKHTGAAAGRIFFNSGSLALSNVVIRNGNVTTEPSGFGGGIYNEGSLWMSSVQILDNQAKKGGGLYNKNGQVNLDGTIARNSATQSGGGVYNQSTSIDAGGHPTANITTTYVTITNNTAKAGGGVFNRGAFILTGGALTSNEVAGTGSDETCTAGQSCDGAGGGIVSAPGSSALTAVFETSGNASIRFNKASGFGGGVYTAGQANMVGVNISDNKAKSGAAIYAVPQGFLFYCQLGKDDDDNPSIIRNNTLVAVAAGRYSILDGILLDSNPIRQCSISNTTIASGNQTPRFCKSDMVRESSVCPQ